MIFDEAEKKIKALSDELDKHGYTSILILSASASRDKNLIFVTYPEMYPEAVQKLITEAAVEIEANPPQLDVQKQKGSDDA